jgi:hypothetical protein
MSTVQLDLFTVSARDLQSNETKLENILDCLNSIPYLNKGGCAISALAIYRWCKENGIEVSDRPFVILYEDEWDARRGDEIIEAGDFAHLPSPHIVIEIGGRLYDSNGCLEDTGLWADLPAQAEHQLNEDELLYAINYKTFWNDLFDREYSIPKIEYGLSIDLSDVSYYPGGE